MLVRVTPGDKSLFPKLDGQAYLAHAAIAPVSVAVSSAVTAVMEAYAERGVRAFLQFAEQREVLRRELAVLLGVKAKELALLGGTTRALSDLALSMPWCSGDRVVLFRGEFPANVTPWQRAAELFGLQVVWLDLAGAHRDIDRLLGQLERVLKQGARLVAVSAVQFQTGLAMPLGEMASVCHRHGAELCVDAIQAVGVVPLSLSRLGVDYAAGGAHKWLLGMEGAGYLYVAEERMAALRPATAGWQSHRDGALFLSQGEGLLRYDRPLVDEPRVFEGGSSAVALFAGMHAGIRSIVDLSVPRIFSYVGQYLDRLEVGLVERGFESLRSGDPDGRSGILSVRVPRHVSGALLLNELDRRRVCATLPDGLLRFSPHFPNPLNEVELVLAALDESIRELRQ